MTIKKSTLEQKWYYRIAKVFFLILPIFVAIGAFFTGYINVGNISTKTILTIFQKNSEYIVYFVIGTALYFIILNAIWKIFLYITFGGLEDDTVRKDNKVIPSVNPAAQIVPIVIILIIFAIFALSQNGFIKLPKLDLNLEQSNLVKKHIFGASCTSNGKTGLYGTNGNCYTCTNSTAATKPINNNCSNGLAGVYCCSTSDGNNGPKKNDKCIPTGCGTLWRCSGNYYVGDKQISVNGLCFPSGMRPADIYSGWSGSCRQCP